MGLFGFGKEKKEENKTPACACKCSCGAKDTAAKIETETVKGKEGINSVKVLGTGCQSCHALFENAKEAVKNMQLTLEVEYVTEMPRIIEYGVMSVPALVINEKVVSMGKVLKSQEIEQILSKAL